jgi:hypoxanthine-DNA glycosylase
MESTKFLNLNCLEPIADQNSVVLILGTMPGVASLSANEYYAHPDNLFWDIMFRVLNKDWKCEDEVSVDYEMKKALLLRSGVALWDVLQYCDRKGNLDKAITNEIKNDFDIFFKEHPKVETIFFNGQKANKYFKELKFKITEVEKFQQFVFQSTSPSNTTNSFRILKEWATLRKFI